MNRLISFCSKHHQEAIQERAAAVAAAQQQAKQANKAPSFTLSTSTPQTPTPPTPTTPGVTPTPTTPATPSVLTQPPSLSAILAEKEKEDGKSKTYVPSSSSIYSTYSVTDCRSLVKTVVCGVKTITWGVSSCKVPGATTKGERNKYPTFYQKRNV